MKRISILGLTCLLAAPAIAEDVDMTLNAAAEGNVVISNISGSITVSGWSRSQVEVTGTLGRNVEKLIFERDGDEITIKVKVPGNNGHSHGHGYDSDLDIRVPQNSSVDIGTISADIDVTEVNGDQDLSSVSGDITTESTGAVVEVEAVSGDVEIEGDNAAGETRVSTVSGDVALDRLAGELSVDTVSGNIDVDSGSFVRAEFNTVSGDIEYQAGLDKGGRLDVETVTGGVDIEFSGDVSARFDIDVFNGEIRNCFGPEAERTSKYLPGWELEFTMGSGDGRVDISTVNGDVSICSD